MIEIRTSGADDLRRLARACREASRTDLPKELRAGVKRAGQPLITAARAHALEILPHAGGLNARVAGAKMTFSVRSSGAGAGIRITATSGKKKIDVEAADRGRIRHLTYGRRPWHNQSVPPGWFSTPMEDGAGPVRDELYRVIDTVIAKLEI